MTESRKPFDPSTTPFNPFAPGVMDDPYPYYQTLREQDPVHQNPELGCWFLSRYADVARIDARLGRGAYADMLMQASGEGSSLSFIQHHNLFLKDGFDHTRLRKAIGPLLSKPKMEKVRPRIRNRAQELLTTLTTASSEGTIELINNYAYPLALSVFAEVFGVPVEDREQFGEWARDFTLMIDPIVSPKKYARGLDSSAILRGYFHALITQRRHYPQEDMLSELVTTTSLSPEEMVSMAITLMVAGFENIVNLIGMSVRALLEYPDQMALLRAHPELVTNVCDEALRIYSTTQYNGRATTEPLQLGDKILPPGSVLILLRGSANRDEEQFPNADAFDLLRDNNREHLGFSTGAYYCLGAPLTYIEIEEAIAALLRRTSKLSLIRYCMVETKLFWGVKELHIAYSLAQV